MSDAPMPAPDHRSPYIGRPQYVDQLDAWTSALRKARPSLASHLAVFTDDELTEPDVANAVRDCRRLLEDMAAEVAAVEARCALTV